MAGPDRVTSPAAAAGGPLEAATRYRVVVLPLAELGEAGVAWSDRQQRQQLAWPRVLHALAAQVGEPDGVRTIVFDLVVERKDDECLVCRFDAEPGESAQAVARVIAARIGRERCSRSLLELAADGIPTRSFADLDALTEDALEELGL